MAARAGVTVYGVDGKKTGDVALPAVYKAPIRHDIVRFVHTNISKNARQPYAVTRRQGHRVTAESWGTGRAVARIPRVGGGGTHRSGEGAYGNQCRGGRMFAPTKVTRRWNRRVNKNLRRYAVTSALAATGLPSLVMARGHKIERVHELPLVVSDKIQNLNKTKEAVNLLKTLKAIDDVVKVKDTKKIRSGVGKSRNRRYVTRKGPLIVMETKGTGWRAFRNLPGVDLAYVSALNLLQLAPGGHLGRFVIFSEAAFRALNNVFGDGTKRATTRHYRLPRSIVSNTDVTRIINSDEVQAVSRRKRSAPTKKRIVQKKALRKLLPYNKVKRNRVKHQIGLKAKAHLEKLKKLGKPVRSDAHAHTSAKAPVPAKKAAAPASKQAAAASPPKGKAPSPKK